MNVLMVEPGKAPYETQIGDDLQSMQALVGGYIQAVYPFEQPVALVCRESGKLDGLPLNRALRDSDGDIYDIVAGNFFIVGLGQNDFTDLPHELAEQFAEQFRQAVYAFLLISCPYPTLAMKPLIFCAASFFMPAVTCVYTSSENSAEA